MKQLVTFNRAMRGMGNPHLIDNDALVADLIAQGVVQSAEPWPPGSEKKPEATPPAHLGRRARRLLGQTYLTK